MKVNGLVYFAPYFRNVKYMQIEKNIQTLSNKKLSV